MNDLQILTLFLIAIAIAIVALYEWALFRWRADVDLYTDEPDDLDKPHVHIVRKFRS